MLRHSGHKQLEEVTGTILGRLQHQQGSLSLLPHSNSLLQAGHFVFISIKLHKINSF